MPTYRSTGATMKNFSNILSVTPSWESRVVSLMKTMATDFAADGLIAWRTFRTPRNSFAANATEPSTDTRF